MGGSNRGKASQESTSPGAPAPGWYPDTGGSGRLRYWNGQAWTEHFAAGPASGHAVVLPAPKFTQSAAPRKKDGRPHGQPVQPWSERLSPQNLVGESFHEAAFKALAAEYGHRSVPDYGVEIKTALAAMCLIRTTLTTRTPSPYGSTADILLGICHATSLPSSHIHWKNSPTGLICRSRHASGSDNALTGTSVPAPRSPGSGVA